MPPRAPHASTLPTLALAVLATLAACRAPAATAAPPRADEPTALADVPVAPDAAVAGADVAEDVAAPAADDGSVRLLTPDGDLLAGLSVDGRPITYSVHGRGADTALLLATIHGDEDAGTPLLERLAAELEADPGLLAGGRVVVVPVANPDGLARGRRHNERGVDLNRNFPAGNRRERRTSGDAALSEPEARALHDLLERYRPDRILSIHGWIGLVDWDGPADDLARAVSERCGLPARRIGSRPGSLGSYAGLDLGIPVLTLELPAVARVQGPDALWDDYGDALLAFVRGVPPASSPESPR